MVAFKITKAQFEKLSDELKNEYKVDSDGKGYTLDVTGIDDPTELRAARDAEKNEHKETKRKLADANKKVGELEEAAGDNVGAVEATEKRLNAKYDRDMKAATDKVTALTKANETREVKAFAGKLANKLSSKAPGLVERIILDRLTPKTEEDGSVTLGFKLADGKDTDAAGLEKELTEDKELAHILTASRASGGGAPRVPETGGARRETTTDPATGRPVPLAKASTADLLGAVRERRAVREQAGA